MADRIKLRRDTAANWTATNPVLAQGEPGFETDTDFLKVGDGVTAWNALSYVAGVGAFVPLAGNVTMTGPLSVPAGASGAQVPQAQEVATNLPSALSASGTSVDFTGIPSWAKEITVLFDVVATNGTAFPLIQIGDSGGVEVTGYTANGHRVTGSPVAQAFTDGFGINAPAASNPLSGSIVLSRQTGNNWIAAGLVSNSAATATYLVSGKKTLSGVLTTIRLTTSNGTDLFNAGTINISYRG